MRRAEDAFDAVIQGVVCGCGRVVVGDLEVWWRGKRGGVEVRTRGRCDGVVVWWWCGGVEVWWCVSKVSARDNISTAKARSSKSSNFHSENKAGMIFVVCVPGPDKF